MATFPMTQIERATACLACLVGSADMPSARREHAGSPVVVKGKRSP